MMIPRAAVLALMCWIAERLGLELGLCNDNIVDSLDDREISEQLQYGRD